MRKRPASLLIGITVLGVVALSLAGGRPDTVPIERPGESDGAGCCCGGTAEGCTGDCTACESDSCQCDGCECDGCDGGAEAGCDCAPQGDGSSLADTRCGGSGGCR